MIRRPLTTALMLSAAALAGANLGGCGRLARPDQLEQPAPLFGDQAKADYAAKQKAAATARTRNKLDNPQSDDPPLGAQPLPQAPNGVQIPGGPSGPNGPAPQGALGSGTDQ